MSFKLKKILKRAAMLFALFIIYISYRPTVYMRQDTGYVFWRWSGWKALFTDDKFGFKSKYYDEVTYSGIDGPYVMRTAAGLFAYRVTKDDELLKEKIFNGDTLEVVVPNESKDIFYLRLKDSVNIPESEYPLPSRLIVISDIEGNFNGFYSFLVNNGVMDKHYNWILGDGHLVLPGDFVDRGAYVTQVLWLIYSLEDKARQSGGMVHYILGNHEVMNIRGNTKYADEKYIKLAQDISGQQQWDKAYKCLFASNTELGAWLRKKNSIEKIGRYVFVHGGIDKELLRYKPSLENINKTIRAHIDTKVSDDSLANFLLGSNGPLWYRGMATEYNNEAKMSQADFNNVLAYLGAKGLLIENGVVYKINDRGQKALL